MELMPFASDVIDLRSEKPKLDIQLLRENVLHGAVNAMVYVPYLQTLDRPPVQASTDWNDFDRAMFVANLEDLERVFWVVRSQGFGRFKNFSEAKEYFLDNNPKSPSERPYDEDVRDLMSFVWNSGIVDQRNNGPIRWQEDPTDS
jgi:hypothetical protein